MCVAIFRNISHSSIFPRNGLFPRPNLAGRVYHDPPVWSDVTASVRVKLDLPVTRYSLCSRGPAGRVGTARESPGILLIWNKSRISHIWKCTNPTSILIIECKFYMHVIILKVAHLSTCSYSIAASCPTQEHFSHMYTTVASIIAGGNWAPQTVPVVDTFVEIFNWTTSTNRLNYF